MRWMLVLPKRRSGRERPPFFLLRLCLGQRGGRRSEKGSLDDLDFDLPSGRPFTIRCRGSPPFWRTGFPLRQICEIIQNEYRGNRRSFNPGCPPRGFDQSIGKKGASKAFQDEKDQGE